MQSRWINQRLEIARFNAENNTLTLVFEDGSEVVISDHAQDCCEHRYMTCDDDLELVRGERFVGCEILSVQNQTDDEYGDVHDIEFLHIRTTGGTLVCQTHNEHNGYYGGFSLRAIHNSQDVTQEILTRSV